VLSLAAFRRSFGDPAASNDRARESLVLRLDVAPKDRVGFGKAQSQISLIVPMIFVTSWWCFRHDVGHQTHGKAT